jgi:hypothetical protein
MILIPIKNPQNNNLDILKRTRIWVEGGLGAKKQLNF